MTTVQNNAVLAAPYRKQIGRVTFQVSSFGSPKAAQTSDQMLLGLMESQIMQQGNKFSREVRKNEGD